MVESAIEVPDPEESEGTWRDRAVERSLRAARAKAESRSDRFIKTAIEILGETGRTDFTVQELVERSKTSLRPFYQHFTSKDELLLALVEEVLSFAIAQWKEEIESLSPLDGLRLIVNKVHGRTMKVEGAGINRALASFNMHLAESRPEDFGRVLAPLYDVLYDAVRRGVKEGVVRSDIDPRALSTILMQTLVGASQLNALRGAPRKPAPKTDLVWEFLLGGIIGGGESVAKTQGSETSTLMRVEVDYGLCESNGVCMGWAPDVFDLRDDDKLYLLREDVPAELEAGVQSAVVGCPRQAIRIVP